MSSLHKDPRGRSPFWYVAYRDGNGVRTFKSTRETDWHRAKVVADTLESIAVESRKPDTCRSFLEQIVNVTLRRLGYETVQQTPTVKEFVEEWLSNQRGSVSIATLKKYTQVVNLFASGVSTRKLQSIQTQDIIHFRDSLLKDGRSPRTVNNLVMVLSIPFRHAQKAGLISTNPVSLVRSLRTSRTVKGVFTPDQIRSLLQIASIEWQGLILAGFYTGARLGDLARLKWTSVDLLERSITFEQGKTGNQVKIPLHPGLHVWNLTSHHSGGMMSFRISAK